MLGVPCPSESHSVSEWRQRVAGPPDSVIDGVNGEMGIVVAAAASRLRHDVLWAFGLTPAYARSYALPSLRD